MRARRIVAMLAAAALPLGAHAVYTNFEVSHVHPIDLTPSGGRLLVVNTPDALLEVFTVEPGGGLVPEASIPVGLEPVTVVARTDGEAWVVNNLSDSISIVDLNQGSTVKTLEVGDEPTDVAFTATRAFVAVSQEDRVKVYNLASLDSAPALVPLAGRDVRALAVSASGQKIYAVVLRSGNRTTVVNANVIFSGDSKLNTANLNALGLRDIECAAPGPPPYPPLPPGIERSPALLDPPASTNPADFPPVGLIVGWNAAAGQWQDEAGQDWSHCLRYKLGDHDLFAIDAVSLAVTPVDHLGTSLFDVSVHPGSGKVYVPHTEARNFVRFEHPLGVQGHVVDNRLAVVDPASDNSVTLIDLNAHIDRDSDPATNLAERQASISQPGMLVWKSDGSAGFLTAIGSRKLFRVDGACLAGSCIFGASRAAPDAVEVGEGPTGVALREAAQAQDERLYVLNRIDHSIAIVSAATLAKLDEIPLHDPSSDATRLGRRFLYDGIDGSGHGDAACSSCHLSGDLDGLAWDLGNPAGSFVSYDEPGDNVRYILPGSSGPVPCDQPFCAAHEGFDPQKGPMTTQTLRGMLEPLHWRGDRATMRDFNMAFVSLMGSADIGPINGKPAGVVAQDMEKFRQFALEMRFPPNPHRKVDDTTPCGTRAVDPSCEVQVQGSLFAGNPTEGALLFDTLQVAFGQRCMSCHAHPFGAAGGKLGGVEPEEETTADAAALFLGTSDDSPHSDLKVAHLRNIYDKLGPVWAAPGNPGMPETKSGFGYSHDGSFPDVFRFLARLVFPWQSFPPNPTQKLRDVAAFLFHFPTGTKPATGVQVTLPQGSPPTGSAADEALLATLTGLGDLGNVDRHCELVASTISGGRPRAYHLSGGSWVTDDSAEPPVSAQTLRTSAQAPITFTCATLGAGPRLGGDRDEDSVLNADDCAPADAETLAAPQIVSGLRLAKPAAVELSWDDQAPAVGSSVRYEVLGGTLSALHATGIGAGGCLAWGLPAAAHTDTGPVPPPGDGTFYLIRAVNPCGKGGLGPGREVLEALDCGD
jgi:DNA-binding beta-propeller fold protein YncE